LTASIISRTFFAGKPGAAIRKKSTDPILRDRREIAHGIDRRRPVERRADAERGRRGHQQRVSVRRLLRDELGADERPAPGLFSIDDRLIEPCRESLGDGAGEKIGERAGRIRHDELDRSRGIRVL
jgi:hypothetical protein